MATVKANEVAQREGINPLLQALLTGNAGQPKMPAPQMPQVAAPQPGRGNTYVGGANAAPQIGEAIAGTVSSIDAGLQRRWEREQVEKQRRDLMQGEQYTEALRTVNNYKERAYENMEARKTSAMAQVAQIASEYGARGELMPTEEIERIVYDVHRGWYPHGANIANAAAEAQRRMGVTAAIDEKFGGVLGRMAEGAGEVPGATFLTEEGPMPPNEFQFLDAGLLGEEAATSMVQMLTMARRAAHQSAKTGNLEALQRAAKRGTARIQTRREKDEQYLDSVLAATLGVTVKDMDKLDQLMVTGGSRLSSLADLALEKLLDLSMSDEQFQTAIRQGNFSDPYVQQMLQKTLAPVIVETFDKVDAKVGRSGTASRNVAYDLVTGDARHKADPQHQAAVGYVLGMLGRSIQGRLKTFLADPSKVERPGWFERAFQWGAAGVGYESGQRRGINVLSTIVPSATQLLMHAEHWGHRQEAILDVQRDFQEQVLDAIDSGAALMDPRKMKTFIDARLDKISQMVPPHLRPANAASTISTVNRAIDELLGPVDRETDLYQAPAPAPQSAPSGRGAGLLEDGGDYMMLEDSEFGPFNRGVQSPAPTPAPQTTPADPGLVNRIMADLKKQGLPATEEEVRKILEK